MCVRANLCPTTTSLTSIMMAESRPSTGCCNRTWTSSTLGTIASPPRRTIAAERAYMIDLHRQVLELIRAGQSWDELYRNVRFSDEVRKWIAFDTMHTLNVMGMYRWVSNHRRGNW